MGEDDSVRRARATAQLLHRPTGRDPLTLVAHLVAVQAQDIRHGPLALRARSRGLTRADVLAQRDSADLIRTWGPRGTLHLIVREDVGWLTGLLLPSSRAPALRRLAQEGVSGTAEELLDVTGRALAGQGPLTKAELGERLARLGCRASGQGIVYLAFLASAHGLAVLGPDRGNKPTYVHSADWLGRLPPALPDRAKAIEELAVRYLRAHGPAGPEDLAAWSGLRLTECRAAFAAREGHLRQRPDAPLWTLRRPATQPPRSTDLPAVFLPAFDEYLLGWRDRNTVLAKKYARDVAPGGGIIRPAITRDGRIIGTWRPNPAAPTLFEQDATTAAELAAELQAEIDDVTRFESAANRAQK